MAKLGFLDASSPSNDEHNSSLQSISQDVEHVQPPQNIEELETSLSEFMSESNEQEFTSLSGDIMKLTNSIQAEEFAPMRMTGLFNDDQQDYDPSGEHLPIPPRARWFDNMTQEQAMRLVELTIGIPAELQRRIIRLESRGDPNATNRDTKACGLKQLMPLTTYPEMLYKYSDMLGFEDLGDKIERYVFARDSKRRPIYNFRAKPGESEIVISECYNIWINVSLGSMNLVEKMRRAETLMMNRHGARLKTFTEADLYIGHFLGSRPDIMLAYREAPNTIAKSLVNRDTARKNHGMFYHRNGRARTVLEMYQHIDEIGPSRTRRVAPFWRTRTDTIDHRMTNALSAYSPR